MRSRNKKITAVLFAASLIIAAGVIALVSFQDKSQIVSSTENKNTDAPESMFKFTGAVGWRQGPTNETSMALFNSENLSEEAPCFTSAEYYMGTVDVATQLEDSRKKLTESGYVITPLGVNTISFQTATGRQEVELHLSETASPSGAAKAMGGNATGFL